MYCLLFRMVFPPPLRRKHALPGTGPGGAPPASGYSRHPKALPTFLWVAGASLYFLFAGAALAANIQGLWRWGCVKAGSPV